MIGKFLKGEFDPEHRRVKTLERLVIAKLNKPETVKETVKSDWAFPEERKSYAASVKVRDLTKNKLSVGVTMHNGKYQAQITCFGKCLYLGSYETEELASQAFLKAKESVVKGELMHKGKLVEDNRKSEPINLPKFVYYHRGKDRYIVQKRTNGRDVNYGTFKVLEEAIHRLTELGFVK